MPPPHQWYLCSSKCTSFVPDSCTRLPAPWTEIHVACQRARCSPGCSDRMRHYWTRTTTGRRVKEHRRNRPMPECDGLQVTWTASAHWGSHSLPTNRGAGTQLHRGRTVAAAVLAAFGTHSPQAFVMLRKLAGIVRLFWNHHENQRRSERARPCLSFKGR
jgi:hypothetical protein